jgi:hypothetical protein
MPASVQKSSSQARTWSAPRGKVVKQAPGPFETQGAQAVVTVASDERYKTERGWKLDTLLRRIFDHGINSLTTDQAAWLERVSEEIRLELGESDED